MNVHTRVCMYVCVCTCVRACVHVCVCVCVCLRDSRTQTPPGAHRNACGGSRTRGAAHTDTSPSRVRGEALEARDMPAPSPRFPRQRLGEGGRRSVESGLPEWGAEAEGPERLATLGVGARARNQAQTLGTRSSKGPRATRKGSHGQGCKALSRQIKQCWRTTSQRINVCESHR